AEDGIRDLHVTGVQTCALPIFNAFFNWLKSVLAAALVLQPFCSAACCMFCIRFSGLGCVLRNSGGVPVCCASCSIFMKNPAAPLDRKSVVGTEWRRAEGRDATE